MSLSENKPDPRLSQVWQNLTNEQKEIISRHQQAAPVPVGRIAEDLGLKVFLDTLRPDISGEIRPCRQAAAGFEILVDRHEPKPRQRFTLAHEIAHFLLHRSDIGQEGIAENVLYRANWSQDVKEHEANRLAVDILMPPHIIDREMAGRQVDDLDEDDICRMAENIGVSAAALSIRLGVDM